MAIHQNIPSMLQESLTEMLLTAKYSIEFEKDPTLWSTAGCYGYPAALLLISIAASIGSYVEGGNLRNNFKILRNQKYYGLNLTDKEIDVFYNFRNRLSHNSVLSKEIIFRIGFTNDPVFQPFEKSYLLNLVPFYNLSVKVVEIFLQNPDLSILCKKIEKEIIH